MILRYPHLTLLKFRFVRCFPSNTEPGIGAGDFDSSDTRPEPNKAGITGVYNTQLVDLKS